MYPDILEPEVLELTEKLDFLKRFDFYLVGGTGLALQWAHRKSVDFDFFTSKEITPEVLSSTIREQGIVFVERSKTIGTLHCLLNGIKTSFIFYNEPLLYKTVDFNALKIADWRDIVVEKLRTISDRGFKKDFYDFYIGVNKLDSINYLPLLRGLIYFEDAERSKEELILLQDVGTWDTVKDYFIGHIKDFEKAFLQRKG
ncbi:MAG: nucleotidyl transferase AbiEii/AbiGii toxin family protein [Planctomycetes bacterium]|nr:nucleotidyl transferase AbiEii/AbiGii toxin family protein [Planctomycetota bacterium]